MKEGDPIIPLIMIAVGGLLIYGAIKDKSPLDVTKTLFQSKGKVPDPVPQGPPNTPYKPSPGNPAPTPNINTNPIKPA